MIQIRGEKVIKEKVETKVSYEKVVTSDKVLKDYKVVSGKTIDYGLVK